jgi:CHRD domain/PEP-CTERM motif
MKKLFPALLLVCSLVSARATVFQYTASLNGAIEVPTNNSAGTGLAFVNYDDTAHTLQLMATFSGLSGTTTASHIHGPTPIPFGPASTAGVATTTPSFAGFPLGVTSGSFSNTLDLTQASSYNPAFVTANGGTTATAEVALANAIAQGRAYWNIHTSFAGGGEIRGYLIAVPEPSSIALIGLGAAVAVRAWNRRRKA